jgi:hypothetical protein
MNPGCRLQTIFGHFQEEKILSSETITLPQGDGSVSTSKEL